MRVALEVTALLGARTGVGVFTAELLDRLAAEPDLDVTVFALTWRGRHDLAAHLPAGVTQATRPMAARPLRECWLRANHPVIERWTGPVDVVHGPNFVVPPAGQAAELVTIHDLTAVRYPELCTADVLQYPDLIRRAIGRGASVHTVSQFVADEVHEHFNLSPDRIVVIPNGAPAPAPDRPGQAERAAGLAGGTRYVLALGTVEPRKNLPLLVAAFGQVAADDPDVRLVIAGPDGWGADALTAAIAAAPCRDRIVRLGWVAEDQRDALLRGATVFAYPSRYEGFGLPPLEAMAVGTPVLATTAGALPEVLGDAALLVPSDDLDALSGALARLLTDDQGLASDLRQAGPRRVSQFSWDTTASRLADLYRRLAGQPAR